MKALLISIILHLSLFSLLYSMKVKAPEQQNKEDSSPIQIRVNSEKGDLVEKEAGQDSDFIAQDKDGQFPCEFYYYGIGWTGSTVFDGWCKVREIAPNSPLAKAGIPRGAYIEAQNNECPGRGEEGTSTTVRYKLSEDGEIKVITLNREKICLI